MKRIIVLAISLSVVLGAIFGASTLAQSDEAPLMTEAHIARIKSNCVGAQATLTQLHASDALMRVNRGQLYESISTRLMVPFNSRIAKYTQYNVALVEVASAYDNELTEFRASYKLYEEAMSRTLKIDCQNQPVAFYDGVVDTRLKRQVTHEHVLVLQSKIKDYKTEFEIFAKNFQEGTK